VTNFRSLQSPQLGRDATCYIVDVTHTVEGRGKRKKRANVLYSSKFWVANDGSDEE
jgi:hypothetical protein